MWPEADTAHSTSHSLHVVWAVSTRLEPGVVLMSRQDSRQTDHFDCIWLQSLRRTAGMHVCVHELLTHIKLCAVILQLFYLHLVICHTSRFSSRTFLGANSHLSDCHSLVGIFTCYPFPSKNALRLWVLRASKFVSVHKFDNRCGLTHIDDNASHQICFQIQILILAFFKSWK